METIRLTRLLTFEEWDDINTKAIAKGFYTNDRRIFLPGWAWVQPWYFDPTGERERLNKHVMIRLADRGKGNFLSPHYWRDWSHVRPPMVIVCPNGRQWEVDRQASNGDGWKVEGSWPNITCTPSIISDDYHGFLRNGEFTADLDGKTWPVPRPYEEGGVMRVKFTDLEPQWCKHIDDGLWREQDDGGAPITAETADGVIFLDPLEFEEKGGSIGCSSVLIWFRGKVADDLTPGPGRWDLINPDFEHFELSPSVDLTMGGKHPGYWHGWVRDGWAI